MTYPTPTHSKDCAYHLDQYSWECDCGATEMFKMNLPSEMLERVAKAIYEGRNGPGARAWGSLPKSHHEPYLLDARAATQAMREPTEAMCAAGSSWTYNRHGEADQEFAQEAWQAMIDEALK